MVTYIDSSVVLAYLLAEFRVPPASFWDAALVSSRLLEYEVWNRINTHPLSRSKDGEARALLAGVELVEMTQPVLARALEPFPVRVRTPDALHLATSEFLRSQGKSVVFASYDNRLLAAARALGIEPVAL